MALTPAHPLAMVLWLSHLFMTLSVSPKIKKNIIINLCTNCTLYENCSTWRATVVLWSSRYHHEQESDRTFCWLSFPILSSWLTWPIRPKTRGGYVHSKSFPEFHSLKNIKNFELFKSINLYIISINIYVFLERHTCYLKWHKICILLAFENMNFVSTS